MWLALANGTLVLIKQETQMHLHVKASLENLPVLVWTRPDLRTPQPLQAHSRNRITNYYFSWGYMSKHLLTSKRETRERKKIPLKSGFGEPTSTSRLVTGAWLIHRHHQKAHCSIAWVMIPWESTILGPLPPNLQKAPAKGLLLPSTCLMFGKRAPESWNFLKVLRLVNFLSFLGLGSLRFPLGQDVWNEKKWCILVTAKPTPDVLAGVTETIRRTV